MRRPICHVLNSYIYASFVPLFLCSIVSRLTYSLRVIPIGVYSSITYIDFVLQYLNNNNNNSSNNNNNNSSNNNNNVNNIKEMLQVKSLQ